MFSNLFISQIKHTVKSANYFSRHLTCAQILGGSDITEMKKVRITTLLDTENLN